MRSRRLLIALTVTVAATACSTNFLGGEQGSGNLVTETREVGSFDRIEVSSAVNLDVVVDESAVRSLTVTYDDNVLDNLMTRVRNETLIIELDGNLNLSGSANRVVAVATPVLDSVEASGATDVTVTGATPRLEIDVSGASSVDLADLTVRDVALEVSGASSLFVVASGAVTGSVSGASSVTVRGDPTTVSIDSSGASSVDAP